MKLLPFNGKAREVCDANQFGYLTVLEGSVRSMKTVTSLIAWLLYVVRSDEKVFLMSGYTAGSLLHNCITEEYGLQNICGGMLTFRADENGRKYMSLGGLWSGGVDGERGRHVWDDFGDGAPHDGGFVDAGEPDVDIENRRALGGLFN